MENSLEINIYKVPSVSSSITTVNTTITNKSEDVADDDSEKFDEICLKMLNDLGRKTHENLNSDSEDIIVVSFIQKNDNVKLLGKKYHTNTNINALKRDLSIMYKIKPNQITLLHNNQNLSETTTLNLLKKSNEKNEIQINIETEEQLEPIDEDEKMVIQDVITVDVCSKKIVVEIEDRKINKPNLGAYCINEKLYNHACSQTGGNVDSQTHLTKTSRDTQTSQNRTIAINHSKEAVVQTNWCLRGLYIPYPNQRILSATLHEIHDEEDKRREEAAKVIQRYFREWKMQNESENCEDEYDTWLNEPEKSSHDKRRWLDIIHKTYPHSTRNYTNLHGVLEQWKKTEVDRLRKQHTKPALIAGMAILLEREIEVLNLIERYKRTTRHHVELQNQAKFFDEISQPIKWIGYKNIKIEMHTVETQQSEKLKMLYNKLTEKVHNTRPTVLTELKESLGNDSCSAAVELRTLIDREIALLNIHVNEKSLASLRERMQLLIVEHTKMECNAPLVQRFRRLRDSRICNPNLTLCCNRCYHMKPLAAFVMEKKGKSANPCDSNKTQKQRALSLGKYPLHICKSCSRRGRVDLAPYKRIFDLIIETETIRDIKGRARTDVNNLLSMLQINDVQYLVDRVWHGKSILSESNNLYELQLVRWSPRSIWTPWNCVLLTNVEAQKHVQIDDATRVYTDHVKSEVFNKHLLARTHFKMLFNLASL